MHYDVVVIGGGLGGLICARQLAQGGRSVVVLERQRELGGCLQSYRRGGLEFDTGMHYVGGLAEGQPLHDAFDTLGLLHLPWVKLDADGFDLITIGSETFPMAEGFDRFVDTLSACFPKERSGLLQFVDLLRRMPSMDESMHLNAYDYLTSLLRDPLLVNVVSGAAMRLELRRESLPLFHFVHSMSSYVQSSWRLKGSGRLIIESLTNDIEAAGGQVCRQAEVKHLTEKGGRIVAATCTNGDTYEGDIFISDVHPQLTFGWLGDSPALKNMFRRRIAAMENSFGMFTVSLVLKPGALPYFNHNKYVYSEANVWEPPRSPSSIDRVMVSCRVPESLPLEGRSGEGLQVDLLTPLPWSACQQWENTVVGRRGQDYKQLKEQMADGCIRLAEQVIPGLGGMVAKRYTSTPLTWHYYTLSPFGSAFGVRKDSRNPLMTALSPRTPIPNLFLTGQSLVLHGVEGVTKTAFNTLKTITNQNI